jgi:hypothetical protein
MWCGVHLSAVSIVNASFTMTAAGKCDITTNMQRILAELADFGDLRGKSHRS